MTVELDLPDEASTIALGVALAGVFEVPLLVGLTGDLGAGKTTLVRALINAEAPGTRVKSPTYTLVESYTLPRAQLHHLDLYRLRDADELAGLGIDELLAGDAIVLVEWPERGAPLLPMPDLLIALAHRDRGRSARISASTDRGTALLARLPEALATAFD